MARIDKYLWAVRLFKTRSLAANQVKNGKVIIDGSEVKASRSLKVGDKFSVKRNTALFTYEVVDLLEKRVGAKLVGDYLRDITPIEEIEKYKLETVWEITSSCGIAEFNAKTDSIETILERADKALYLGKEYGRNRVEKA